MRNRKLNHQIRSYMSYKGQKTNKDYYEILYDKLPYEIVFKKGYYSLKLLYDAFRIYPNCNILTFNNVDFCNAVEFDFMLNLVNDTKQINILRFKVINVHIYINELVKFIKNNHTIKALSLNQSNITNEDLKLLCEAMKENDTLTTLDFSENNSFSDITPICELIRNNKNISTLYFDNVYNCDFIPLIETLKTNNTIKKLKIYDTEHLFDNFCDMLILNNSIDHFSYRNMHKIDITKIEEVLKTNKILSGLSLYNDVISNWEPLFEGLKENNTLTYLNLNNCEIHDYSPFYKMIKNNSSLKVIKLSHYCTSIDNNCESLIEALEHNKVIERLNVQGIKINDALRYLKAIYFHPTLKECIAAIDEKDKQIVCNALNSERKLPDIGYQTYISYRLCYESKDECKHIGQFVY